MKKLIDFKDPFFAPVWIRVTVAVVLFGWGLIELNTGEPFWATGFIGLAIFCAWRFATIDYSAGREN